jgi:carbohydrate esterase-like sialic acid-specific acetylesterase
MTLFLRSFCLLALAWPGLAQAAGVLEVTSPVDYQVIQRKSAGAGQIVVSGKYTSGNKIVARLGEGPWQPVKISPESKTFFAEMTAPAGGWYAVKIRVSQDDAELAESTIFRVGVGEVFIVAGQSNAANYGSVKLKPETGKVSSFDGMRWYVADDPQRGADGTGGSFMPAFGDELVRALKIPVGLVPCAVGATSIRQWLPRGERMTIAPTTGMFIKPAGPGVWESTGQAYDGLLSRLKPFGPHGVRAVLWHQGESDCGQARDHEITGDQYRAYAVKLIQASRKDAGWKVPWFVAQVSYHGGKTPLYEGIRQAQKSLWDDGLALEGPDTDKLRDKYRAGVHFNGKGLKAHGRLWADMVLPTLP